MTRFIVLLLLGVTVEMGFCQNPVKYSALLINLNGEGTIKRSSQNIDLQMPQFFVAGDNLSLKKGEALIMLFSGEEIKIKASTNYKIPENIITQSTEVQKLSESPSSDYGLLAQAGAAYSIRGVPQVFPLKSKLLDPRNAILRIYLEKTDTAKPVIKVVDSQSQKAIFEKQISGDSLIKLSEVPFRDGSSYYWTISGMPDNKPRLGSIVIPDKNERTRLKTFSPPKTNIDFITEISYYYSIKYFFEALALTEMAIEKFPEIEIYRLFLENLKNE